MAQNSQAVIPDNIIIVDGELNPVPTPEAGDSGKVLTVVDSDGTIGWSPVSASGTQLQADWSVTDDTSVQYIAHKPDLSVYATTSSVTTALAGKQDTISDLSDIRSGAAAGATAVQPADLADYVEASSLAAVATSGSYNDLIDKPTIPSGDDLVPSATSADEGKVLTVDSEGSTAWVTPSAGTTYSAGDGIDISAQNVVSADVDGSTIGIDSTTKKIKLLSTIPTVDQNYNASSTNAQSGTAVAQAIAAIPSASYTAGDGIDITANEVSVKAGRNLGFEANSTTVTLKAPTSQVGASDYGYALLGKLDSDTVALLKSGTVSLTPKYNYTISMTGIVNSGARFAICQASGYGQPQGNGKWLISEDVLSTSGDTSFVLTADTAYNVDFSSLSSKSTGTWTDVEANPTNFYLALAAYSTQYSIADVQSFGNTGAITNPPNPGDVSSYTIGDPSDIYLYAVDQIPASTSADENKVLTVNSSGNAVWATPATVTVDQTYNASSTNAQSGTAVASAVSNAVSGLDEVPTVTSSDNGKVLKATYSGGAGSYAWATDSDTTYTAGNMINISNQNAIGVSTTAGITDIQKVNALPANPVSTVLYLIPET